MQNKEKYWVNSSGIQTLSLAILAVIGVGFALSITKNIMIPFVLSVFLYFILSPLRAFFINKLKFPKSLALFSTFFTVAFILFLVFSILLSAIQEFASGYSMYEAKAVFFADSLQEWLTSKGIPLSHMDFSKVLSQLPVASLVKGAGAGFFGIFSTTVLVFIFLAFLFTGAIHEKPAGEEDLPQKGVLRDIHLQIQKYLGVKVLTSTATGLLTFIALTLLGLDLAFVLSFLAFVLNFIPTIGSLFAVLLPLPVAFFQFELSLPFLLVFLIPGGIQFTIGNLLEPKFMGQSLNLHPVVVLLSLMFWSLIWGVAGAFMAVPITAVVKIVLEKVEGGRLITQAMAGVIGRNNDEA